MRLHVLNLSHSLNSCCLFYCRFVVGDQKAALSYTRGEFCSVNSVFLHSLPAEGSPSVLQVTSLKMLLFPSPDPFNFKYIFMRAGGGGEKRNITVFQVCELTPL